MPSPELGICPETGRHCDWRFACAEAKKDLSQQLWWLSIPGLGWVMCGPTKKGTQDEVGRLDGILERACIRPCIVEDGLDADPVTRRIVESHSRFEAIRQTNTT